MAVTRGACEGPQKHAAAHRIREFSKSRLAQVRKRGCSDSNCVYGPDYGLEGCGPEDFDRFFFASPPGEESSYNLLCDNASEIGSAAKAGCGDAEKPPPKVFVSV